MKDGAKNARNFTKNVRGSFTGSHIDNQTTLREALKNNFYENEQQECCYNYVVIIIVI
jgi:hypothetical protein